MIAIVLSAQIREYGLATCDHLHLISLKVLARERESLIRTEEAQTIGEGSNRKDLTWRFSTLFQTQR